MYLLKAKKRVAQEPSPTEHDRILPANNDRYKNRQPQIDTNGKLPGIIKHCKVKLSIIKFISFFLKAPVGITAFKKTKNIIHDDRQQFSLGVIHLGKVHYF